MKKFNLEAINQKSFYGKAKVIEADNGTITLQSYLTDVCKIVEGKFVRIWNGYSVTTMNHVNAFRVRYGLEPLNRKAWEALPAEADNGGRYKVEYSNGFFSHTTSAVFGSYTEAEAEAERISANNNSLFAYPVEA